MAEIKCIYGLHEPGGEHLMSSCPGWIVTTHELGSDPAGTGGVGYELIRKIVREEIDRTVWDVR